MGTDMTRRRDQSQLFLLRLWVEEAGQDGDEWRGKVQHVVSGEAHLFRDWPMLIDLLLTMLSVREAGEPYNEEV